MTSFQKTNSHFFNPRNHYFFWHEMVCHMIHYKSYRHMLFSGLSAMWNTK